MKAAPNDTRECPRCGSPMVRATAKSGRREGLPLWRCSDFSCPTVINIDESEATPPRPVAGESAQARFEFDRAAHQDRLRRGTVLLVSVAALLGLGAFFTATMFVDQRTAGAIGLLIV